MQTDRLRTLVDESGPYATVYYDNSHNTEDASTVADLRVRAILDELTEQGADESVRSAIETALTEVPPPAGPSGRAVIAGPRGIAFDEQLIRPAVTTEVRVSELPYLVPIVEHAAEYVAYAVALVDHAGAEIMVHRVDNTGVSTTVDGGGYPVHKASGAETSGYGDPQPRAEEAARKNLRAAADEVSRVVDSDGVGVVFIGGDAQAIAELRGHLPERVLERAVDIVGVTRAENLDSEKLRGQIDEEFARRHLAELDAAIERYKQDEGTGRTAQGLAEVTAALRAGNVDTLIVGDLDQRTVVSSQGVVAADADTLKEYGADESREIRADEALPAAAVGVGASIVRTDERFAPADGVAAVLRFDEYSSADSEFR